MKQNDVAVTLFQFRFSFVLVLADRTSGLAMLYTVVSVYCLSVT